MTTVAPSTRVPSVVPSAQVPRAPRPKAAKPTIRARRGAPASSTPLIRTFTRIIGVVPAPLRILIALLAGLALALAARSRLTLVRARRLERQRAELLADVGLLQAALLPEIADHVGPIRVSAAYQPADGPAAGGDFYDVFELPDGRVGIVIGDLSGHGRRALPHTALVRFTLRAHLEAGLSPRHAIQTAAPVLERQLGESYATVLLGLYDPGRRRLVYASAGHPPPVIVADRPLVAKTVCCSPPIGMAMQTGMRQTTIDLPGQATACLYTDGVVESRSSGEMLGIDGLARMLVELGPRASARRLLAKVEAETKSRPDDMAACLLTLGGQPAPAQVLSEELELLGIEGAEEQISRFLYAFGASSAEVGETIRQALPPLHRDRSVVIQVGLWTEAPTIDLRPGDLSLFGQASTANRERRRIANDYPAAG
jgi:serine phosphatase RsbU (regulator of sigma subunit)